MTSLNAMRSRRRREAGSGLEFSFFFPLIVSGGPFFDDLMMIMMIMNGMWMVISGPVMVFTLVL